MLTLNDWSEKTASPSDVFSTELNDIVTWSGLPNNTTASVVWNYLLHKYGDIAISDYDKSYITALTALWHSANTYKFAGLAASTNQIYNPIENYNRTETETTERTPDLSTATETVETPRVSETTNTTRTPNVTETETVERTPRTTETETHNLSNSESGTTGTATTESNTQSSDTTGKVAPFDGGGVFSNSAESVGSVTGSGTISETVTHGKTTADTGTVTRATTGTDETETERTTTGTDTTQTTKSATGTNTTAETRTETGTDTTERETHISGNIGVTTTQEMLEQERKIVNFVFLDRYLADWVNAFCVGVWGVGENL